MTRRKLNVGERILITRGSYKGEYSEIAEYSEEYDTYGIPVGVSGTVRWFSRYEIKAVTDNNV